MTNNTMFTNEAADAVHQIIMLGGETTHSVAYMQQLLQAAYELGAKSAVTTTSAPVTAPKVQPTEPKVQTETPAELVAEMTNFVSKNKKEAK